MASDLGRRDEVLVRACHDEAVAAVPVYHNVCRAAALACDDEVAVAEELACRNACRDAHNAVVVAAANACDAYASCSS